MTPSISPSWRPRLPRVALRVLVRVEVAGQSHHYFTRNVSTGGVFLLSDRPLPEETRVHLELYIPPATVHPIRAAGEVVWRQRQEPAGFAVRFVEISASDLHQIRSCSPVLCKHA